VLDAYPEVGVVLSTSWRTVRSERELLDPLPPALRARILGATPKFSECTGRAARLPYRRQAECQQWLETHGMAAEAWWALDDRPDWFAPYLEQLIECDSHSGFDERVARRLASAFELARQRAARSIDFELA
jgi:hypothetical protein